MAMTMKAMKKLYRADHGVRGICPTCTGDEGVRNARRCCADGSVIEYGSAAPGLRAFARDELKRCGAVRVGKLQEIVAQA